MHGQRHSLITTSCSTIFLRIVDKASPVCSRIDLWEQSSFLDRKNRPFILNIRLWSAAKVSSCLFFRWLTDSWVLSITICLFISPSPDKRLITIGAKFISALVKINSSFVHTFIPFAWRSWRVFMHWLWILDPLSNFVKTISSPSSSVPNDPSNWGLALSAIETVSWKTVTKPTFFNSSIWALIEMYLFVLWRE